MWKRISNFIVYNNAFTILLWILLLSGGTVLAANEDVREAVATSVISSTDVVKQVDNSLILNTNVNQFDFALQITGVTEDQLDYHISYTYRTLEVRDSVWQQVEKEDLLTIAKSKISIVDFETFVQTQLAEFIESQRQLLIETKDIEIALGQRSLVVERSYSGLIGKFLDTKEIVSQQNVPKVVVSTTTPNTTNTTNSSGIVSSGTSSSTNPIATSTPTTTGTSTPSNPTATSTPSTPTSTATSTSSTEPSNNTNEEETTQEEAPTDDGSSTTDSSESAESVGSTDTAPEA